MNLNGTSFFNVKWRQATPLEDGPPWIIALNENQLYEYDNYDEYLQEFNKRQEFKDFYVKDQQDALDLINYLIDKKDYFVLESSYIKKIFGNIFILLYKRIKNKSFIDLYHETFKNNYQLTSKAFNLQQSIYYDRKDFKTLAQKNIIEKCINSSTNFAEFVKFLEKIHAASMEIHNSGYDGYMMSSAVLNKHFDLADSSNEEFLNVIHQLKLISEPGQEAEYLRRIISNINIKAKTQLINFDKFAQNYHLIAPIIEKFNNHEPISWKRGTVEYNALKEIDTDLSLIQDFETISDHIRNAEPKDEHLQNFNLELSGNYEFKVLKYLDPYAFKVGAATDCCQRIGGAGAEAAIDSFINPVAGVLILSKHGALISQSYFHYVPQEENYGLILDNIESNDKSMKHFGLDRTSLSKLYADYAIALKQKYPNLSYIRCGKAYNKIDNSLFESSSLKNDPRSFSVEEPYSDFDEKNHLDLLNPNKVLLTISNVPNAPVPNIVAKKIYKLITTSFVRKMMMSRIING